MEIVLLVTIIILCFLLISLNIRSIKQVDGNENLEQAVRGEFRDSREESSKTFMELRSELSASLKGSADTLVNIMGELGKAQTGNLELIAKRITELTESNEGRIDKVRSTIDTQLKRIQESNEKKLDQMRQTVDEKLHSTLEKRLGESFKLVSERLEAVQRGLGEMQNLATGVGDLKRVLTNVKARGTWAEVQLGALLEQILAPEQYAKNVKVREDSSEVVEFAIRLPGTGTNSNDSHIWLPIDSKFPQEDYLRLMDASDKAKPEEVQKATNALLRSIKNSAKDIYDKYIVPPHTTDFAIMFLPTEGLYAEVVRQPGQVEEIQLSYRVVVAGPTTLAAILNSLRMGFQTVALEKRSHEVWQVLAAVKTEFGKFGGVLASVKKQLQTASNTIDKTAVRTRAMERKLKDVEQLPEVDSTELLGLQEPIHSYGENSDNELNP